MLQLPGLNPPTPRTIWTYLVEFGPRLLIIDRPPRRQTLCLVSSTATLYCWIPYQKQQMVLDHQVPPYSDCYLSKRPSSVLGHKLRALISQIGASGRHLAIQEMSKGVSLGLPRFTVSV